MNEFKPGDVIARPLRVRDLAHQLQDLSRRGFGDDTVRVEVGALGNVTGISATASEGVRLVTDGVA